MSCLGLRNLGEFFEEERVTRHNSIRPETPAAVRGRPFAKGNAGRPHGSLNRTTRVAAAFREGEAEALRREAVEAALAGNALLLKFFAERLYPRERLICLELPAMEFAYLKRREEENSLPEFFRQEARNILANLACLILYGEPKMG